MSTLMLRCKREESFSVFQRQFDLYWKCPSNFQIFFLWCSETRCDIFAGLILFGYRFSPVFAGCWRKMEFLIFQLKCILVEHVEKALVFENEANFVLPT